jgi:hypothetical protein
MFMIPSQKVIAPASGNAISITDDCDELNKLSTIALNASVSPKKISFTNAMTNAITKKEIQI